MVLSQYFLSHTKIPAVLIVYRDKKCRTGAVNESKVFTFMFAWYTEKDIYSHKSEISTIYTVNLHVQMHV